MKTGDEAKDFALKDQNSKEVRLSDLNDKKVLLSFHPLAWTPVCSEQMLSLEKNFKRFEKLKAVALGISVDTIPSKKAWAKQLGIKNTKLLSDFWPHGEVAKLYNLFREKEGFSERANVVIHNNKIAFFKVYPISQLPDIEEIIKVLES